jgi:hypothetical protein
MNPSSEKAQQDRGHGSTYPLLAALVAIIGVAPFGVKLGATELVFDLLLSAVILAGVWVARDHRLLYWGVGLGLPALALMWTGLALESTAMTALGFVFGLATVLLVIGIVLRGIVRISRVTLSSVTGGICGYLLLGIAWAYVFALLEAFDRGSFLKQGEVIVASERGLQALLYYAFVTLSTLGYGDVVPATPPAEGLAVLAAVSGQLYLAILVAALVARFVAREFQD